MANIAQGPRIQQRAQNSNADVQAYSGGSNPEVAILGNSNPMDAGDDGQSGGGKGGQHEQPVIARGINSSASDRPWLVGDSVLNNVGPFGHSTYAGGSMQHGDWNKRFSATQGKQIQLAGELPNAWQSQMNSEVDQVRIQHRPMNRDFVVSRYNIPIRV